MGDQLRQPEIVDILLTQSYMIERDPPEKRIMRPYPPLGIMYLASFLKNSGFNTAIIDNTFEKNLNTFTRFLEEKRPPIVGISAVEITRKTALEMCGIARDHGCRIIAGGPDPVNYRNAYFNAGVDWICAGEGESTLVNLLNSIKASGDVGNIPGIYHKTADGEVFNSSERKMDALDNYPFPAWEMLDIDSYMSAWTLHHGETSLPVISSRGCPRDCTWCSRSVFGKSFRRRSVDNFIGEIGYLKDKYNPSYFWFADDSFTASIDWLENFHKAIIDRHVNFTYECLGRVDEIKPRTAQILLDTGCRFVWFGAESGSQRVLDSMKKGFKVDDIRKASMMLRERNLPFGFFVMLGYPPEDKSDILKTAEMIRELKPDKVGVSIAYPIAGTEFYNMAAEGLDQTGWTSSGENRILFKTRYNRYFYQVAKRLILKEAQINRMEDHGFVNSLKLSIYRTGFRAFSMQVIDGSK
jgi:anaerobic magnesium-protoporphyrin IX monomethyl ester cyclase